MVMPSAVHGAPKVGTRSKEKVQIIGDDTGFSSGAEITFSFPSAMVQTSEIDVEAKSSPIRFEPTLPGKFIWKSQTEGELKLGVVPPGKKFKILLAPDLADLEGKPVRAAEPLGSRESAPFTVNAVLYGEKLDRRPSVSLQFNMDVRPADLVNAVWFQECESRQRYPVEVVLEDSEKQDALVRNATVTPRADLPGGKTFDLIVDGLKEASTGTRLAEVYVNPLGSTEALHVEKVAAFNYPMQRRRIAVEFNGEVDPVEGRKIKIDPQVKNLEVTAKYEALWLQGDFELGQRYKVTIPADVTGKSGFPMASESQWGATFKPKKSTLIFPTEDLHQRASLGLRFAFMQVNAGTLQWKLARIPSGKLLAIHKRLREFTEKEVDPVTDAEAFDPESGLPKWVQSELLIDASRLETVAQGTIEAAPVDADTRREIRWKPETGLPSGAYVLEVTGKNAEGKTIANRALITFTEYAIAQKQTSETRQLHVMKLADGSSVPQMRVRAISKENVFLAEAVTDKDGMARFTKSELFSPQRKWDENARWFLLETPDGQMLQAVDTNRYNSGFSRRAQPEDHYRLAVTSDRPLYRPGQLLKFKGFAREADAKGELHVPHSGKVTWQISGKENEEAASGTAKLDAYGGFEGEWKIPGGIKVGEFRLSATLEHSTAQQFIAIQEFRPPPFMVALADQKLPGAQSGIRVTSAYFHGAANAGARVQWKAIWSGRTSDDTSVLVTDKPRLASGQREFQKAVSGEGVLGANGLLDVKCAQPFTDGIPRGWYDVKWTAEVTAVDGQTIAETSEFPVFAVPVQLSVTGQQTPKVAGSPDAPLAIVITGTAINFAGKPATDIPVAVEVYHVVNKSVKEQITEHVYRYRNSTAFEKENTETGLAPLKKEIAVKKPGEYLVALRHTENKDVPVVSMRVYVSGAGDAEFPLRDEESIGVTCDKEGEDKGYAPGETAVLSVQAPFAGVAWVSVEAEDILETFIVPLNGNSGRIEVPIKKEYGPNAWATVYLLRPGGADKLPAERFGSVELAVKRPDLNLKVEPVFSAKQVQPKDKVSGEIMVSCEGKPVADADLTVYAVDEAVLDAGDWHEPPLCRTMYPQRQWAVESYHGLERLSSNVETASLHQKGFIIGDMFKGGPQMNVKDLRTDFPPLAYWETHLRSDRHGKVPFSFKAPDGLTKYRVITLAQTKQSQFGTGSDWVEVSKPVQIEPSLPRFLRVGDEVELRAIVRQRIADEMPVTVRCTTGLTLEGKNTQTQKVKRGLPTVYRFRATVGELTNVPIRLETLEVSTGLLGSKQPGDAVEISLPVHPPTLLRKESLFAPLAQVQKEIPKDWTQASGSVDVTLSTSPWLPKLTGLPLLLEYPHGCFEQITSRVLGYTVLGKFLAFLPQPAGREEAYRKRIEDGIGRMNTALTTGGFLPYWPGGQPSALPTVSGYWAVSQAASLGIPVPSRLKEKLAGATTAIALGQKDASFSWCIRAYALMVLADGGSAKVLGPPIRELYERREGLDEDGRALLAIAMHRLSIMPQEKEQLLREIDRPLKERAFDPNTFSSTTRAEAIRALAFATTDPNGKSGKARETLRQRIDELLDGSQSLSTQENFWLLLAFKALHEQVQGPSVKFSASKPTPAAISRNGSSALWNNVDLRHIQEFAIRMEGSESLHCLMQAQYRSDSPVTNRNDRGFRVERVVKNLTDNSRVGTAEAPFRLGDQILVTYRVISPKLHHYVALEDELPAALETVNPSIASIARTYPVPQEKDARQLSLSYSELRDRITCLYFDRVEPGVGTYSVLARATCAGTFRWPATQVAPMYDNRFSGLSPSSVCHVSGE